MKDTNTDSVKARDSKNGNGSNDEPKTNNPKVRTKPQTVFVGFYRNEGGELYALHPQALSSEESMINKIKIMYGDVDVHIFSTELPA